MALALSILGPASGQPPVETPTPSSSLSFELGASIGGSAPGAARDLEAADLALSVQGEQRKILAVEPMATSRVVLFFDLGLATPQGVAAAARELGRRAQQLVDLGPVQILVGDVVAEPFLSPTRDAEELRSALAEVERERALEAGTLLELRAELLAQLEEAGEDWESPALDVLEQEDNLVRWQLQGMFDALVDVPGQDERVVLLVQDGFDLDPLELVRRVHERPSPRFVRRAPGLRLSEQRRLARTLAALGFTVVPLALAGDPAPEILPSPRAPQAELATATGGTTVSGTEELDLALTRLARRWRLRYSVAELLEEPTPVDLAWRAATGATAGSALPELHWRRFTTTTSPSEVTASRARRILEGELEGQALGRLEVHAVLIPEEAVGTQATGAVLEAHVRVPEASGTGPWDTGRLRVTLYTQGLDSGPKQVTARGTGQPFGRAGVRYQARVDLPADLEGAVVLVEVLREKLWGAAVAELSDRSLAGESGESPTLESADLRALGDRREPSGASFGGTALIQIVPPPGSELRGRVTVKTLVSNAAVNEVRFYLDGAEAAIDRGAPFGAEVDLGAEVAPHQVVVRALSQAGIALGEDSLVLNAPLRRLGISLTQITLDPATREVRAAAEVVLAPEAELDRVEFFRNERLVTTLTRPPYEARLPAPPPGPPTDYVRVVAWLADGAMLEDVRLLGASGAEEAVQVNLVQVFVVVSDGEGEPVVGLTQEDFELRRAGAPQAIERFALAEQVPLVLGLVIDTSFSMDPIMSDTQTAAARFLGETVSEIDRAFVVDFDDSPRLVHPISDQLFELLQAVGRLQAKGMTALYDAIVFSLLQFDERPGRRALVLLSDGDDVKSRFGYGRTYQTAKRSGVPIYVIALGGLDPERPSFRKDDLEGIAAASSGRVFYVESMAEVAAAYRTIATELRSQYVLGFSTDRRLGEEELQAISVEVREPAGAGRKGRNRELRVRRSVGQGL